MTHTCMQQWYVLVSKNNLHKLTINALLLPKLITFKCSWHIYLITADEIINYHWTGLHDNKKKNNTLSYIIFYWCRENRFSFSSIFPSLWQRRNLSLHNLSAKQQQNPCSGSPPVYQDLSMYHDWLVKKATVNLPISMKGNSKRTSINLLSPLGAQNIDLSATSQTILTKVKLCLRRRLSFSLSTCVCFYSLSYHKMLVITDKASYFIYH